MPGARRIRTSLTNGQGQFQILVAYPIKDADTRSSVRSTRPVFYLILTRPCVLLDSYQVFRFHQFSFYVITKSYHAHQKVRLDELI